MTHTFSARPSPPRCRRCVSPHRAEVVILKDGFVIQGNVHKGNRGDHRQAVGRPIQIIKANGF